VSEQVDS